MSQKNGYFDYTVMNPPGKLAFPLHGYIVLQVCSVLLCGADNFGVIWSGCVQRKIKDAE